MVIQNTGMRGAGHEADARWRYAQNFQKETILLSICVCVAYQTTSVLF